MYLGLDRAHFLSPTGQCKPFDDSADGYCRSEGCGAFVIKKLSDAVSEGDRILGIIKGIEINQSGNAQSITHPHSSTQEDLFQTLLKKSKIHPHQVRNSQLRIILTISFFVCLLEKNPPRSCHHQERTQH